MSHWTALWLLLVCLVQIGRSVPLVKDILQERNSTIEEFLANGGKPWEYKYDILPSPRKKSANPNKDQDWPFGYVPYTIDGSMNAYDRQKLQRAFDYYKQHTCVRWVPRTNQKDYVVFKKPSDGTTCNSYVGRLGIGPQTLNLAQWCLDGKGNEPAGGALHEMMHCLGFSHEQQRPDRDGYIWIYWDNIDPNFGPWFDIYKGSLTYGTRYDYHSVMHYTAYAGSKNRKMTMVPKDNTDPNILGNRGGSLSSTDIYRIKYHFNCDGQWSRPRYNRGGDCVDKHNMCNYWARQVPSNCDHDQYQGYMMGNCAKMCEVCGPSQGCFTHYQGKLQYVKGAFLSPMSCKRNCFMQGYKYAGLKSGNQCVCSNNVGSGKVSASYCRGPKCPGDASKYCGGNRHWEVFKT